MVNMCSYCSGLIQVLYIYLLAEEAAVKVRYTLVAHDKVVNSCCVSPNDRLLATGSQDHSAKVSFKWFITNRSCYTICVLYSELEIIVLFGMLCGVLWIAFPKSYFGC